MISLDIVTPARRIVEGAQVASVTLPSLEGEMTVLESHTELMAVVGTGVLSYAIDGRERKFAVSGGFLEVRENHVTVLAEYCEEAKEIDRAEAHQEQQDAEQALGGAESLSPEEFENQRNKLARAFVRQQISGDKSH